MRSKQNNLPNQLLHASLQHHQAGRLREAAEGYREILKKNPQHSDALHLLGVIFQQQGQLDLAIELMKAAVGQNTSIAHYHHNLGNTYLQAQRPKEAVECYRQAILLKADYYEAHNGMGNALADLKLTEVAAEAYRNAVRLQPSFADAHYNLGRILVQLKKTAEAIACYRAAIQLDGKRADYFFNLGGLFLNERNYPEALDCYRKAFALQPNDAEILCNLGAAHAAMHNRSEAEIFVRKAITLKPDYATAHLQLGCLSYAEGKDEEARISYEFALKLDPALAEALWGLGNLQFRKERYAEAERYYRKALEHRLDYSECHKSLAQTLLVQDRCQEAAESYRRAIELQHEDFEAYGNLGITHLRLNNYAEAQKLFHKALEIQPDYHEARYTLASLLEEQQLNFPEAIACYREILKRLTSTMKDGKPKDQRSEILYKRTIGKLALSLVEDRQLEAAMECYREALLNYPEDGMLHTNFAIALLKSGNLLDGWREHEWRWKMEEFPTKQRNFGRPLWRGEALHGATIFLHIEQGYGDILQMIRYVPHIVERGGKVLLESPPTLCRLLKGMPGIDQIRTTGEVLPHFSFQCPLMSLPLALETTLDTVPSSVPYLRVPEAEIKAARRLWPGEGLRVGLVWSGNPKHAADAHRSIQLEQMLPLGTVPGVSFYSLQVGEKAQQQLAEIASVFPIADVCSQYTDFADTAAFVAGLDLVITVDTSVAHLAGALGIPVWILLSYVHTDWRWLLNRSDSPWYPSARLFRQSEPGDWAEVIETVKTELALLSESALAVTGFHSGDSK